MVSSLASLEQFQNVVNSDRSLYWILEVDLDNYFKFSPASFSDFIWRFGHCPVGVGVAVVQLKVNFLHISRHVFISVWLDIHSPLVSVAVLFSLLTEIFRHVP